VLKDESWPVARLIPISSATGVEAQERRAVSALLAVMSAVEEFGRALLKPLGAPAGRVEAFIEVPFKFNQVSLRPDGIVAVTRAGSTWGGLVEGKTAQNAIDATQLDLYLDLARELELDCVITVSNQFSSSSSQYPVDVDRRKLRKVVLHHWSWIDVLTEAVVQKEHRGVSDPDQAYILGELIRYLSDPRSGVMAFASMGPSWTAVREGARARTLRRGDEDVTAVAARWDDLLRYVALELTQELGRDVRHALPPRERTPEGRQQALQESLAERGVLSGVISVPSAAGEMILSADLRAREISAATRVAAPQEGRSRGRVSWLLRQLAESPDELKIESRAAYASGTIACSLSQARSGPEALFPEGDREIKEFTLTLSRVPGLNRDAGRGSFAESVIELAKAFYEQVLQPLRAWKEPAPKLVKRQPEAREIQERVVETIPAIAAAVREAQEEAPHAGGPITEGAEPAPSDEEGQTRP
jgi:hypothetical protein